MRALTVRQPWAWAIVHGGKDVENRTRNIAGGYRGPVAIHAGLAWDDDHGATDPRILGAICAAAPHDAPIVEVNGYVEKGDPEFEFGVLIGVVDLVDVHEATPPEVEWCGCSTWAERFHVHHLVLANPRPLAWPPIPSRGALGLWTLPDALEAQIREQVAL